MMRRVIAALAAILMAGVGALLLLSYVGQADQRAMAGMQAQDVLVATVKIPEGTTAEALTKMVATKALPATAVTTGSLSSLDTISGQVATSDVMPGEQLLASRFVDPASLAPQVKVLKIPAGMQQLSIMLDSQRSFGGGLAPGDTVGVFITVKEKTHLVLHKVLVTKVLTTAAAPAEGDVAPEAQAPLPVPEGSALLTLAMSAADAEKLVFGMEAGTVWLSSEPANAVTTGTRVVDEVTVHE